MNTHHARRIFLLLAGLIAFTSVSVPQQNAASRPTSKPDLRIRLQAYSFDPLRQMPTLDERLTLKQADREASYRLIQFKGPLTGKQMEMLKTRYRLKLDSYVPNFAYLEKLSLALVDSLRKFPQFRWAGNYEPAYKIEKELGTKRFTEPGRKSLTDLILLVVLFKDADMDRTVRDLTAAGATVLRQFKLPRGNRIRVKVPNKDRVPGIANIPAVQWIEEEGEITIDNGTTTAVIQSNTAAGTPLYAKGIRGEGQIIGMIDNGLDTNHCFFSDAAHFVGPNHRKVVGFREDNAPTLGATCTPGHGTHTSGTAAGQTAGGLNNGIAFNARLTFGQNADLSAFGGTRSFLEYLNGAKADGAFIHSNSWSDKSTASYTTLSSDLDSYTWDNEDDIVVVSSGNNVDTDADGITDSPHTVNPPWNSKNSLVVAASGQIPGQANVSTGGVGPTGDGRRKPEIYAPGTGTVSATATTTCGTMACTGSSMATPAVAGGAALVRQYYAEGWYPSGTRQPHNAFVPSGALIKATLLNGTRDMTGTDAFGVAAPINGYPTNLEGWGRLVLDDGLYFSGDARNLWVWDVRHENGLTTGTSHNYSVNVAATAQALKMTLVWMEPPPAAASFATPVVNDLDLVVTAPNGDVFRGNDFTNSQSTVNGATADNLNNVEMALVTTPQVGQYQISVNGTAVNLGNPGQGYALVVTADTDDPPVSTGTQNTLVVRTGMSDIAAGARPPLLTAQNIMTNVAAYVAEASYGTTTIDPQFVETSLSQTSVYYYHPSRNLLIEMATEAIANLVTADPNVFTRGTADPADDIDRIVLLTNDMNFTGDWATTGPWPYDLPGGLTRRISVSVNSVYNDPERRVAHALCHQLGLWDLYAHPNVVFAQPHVDEWDIMANMGSPHPMAWSKERAVWMTTHDPNSILFVPRPGAGVADNRTVPINVLTSTGTANKKAIAIGLTPGVTSIGNENVFYFVEARSNAAGTRDNVLPGSGVLVYYVNENIRQGEGPVTILDRDVSTLPLSDAALGIGDSKSPGGTGLSVTVQAPTGSADYNIQIAYDPPESDNDVSIAVGDPSWTSPDIWVDSQKDGFDVESGRTPEDRGDQPVTGEVNRIYFRVTNPGPGDAFDFTVFVRVSEPYHTVGGIADFNTFVGQKFYAQLAAGGTLVDYVEWTPADDGDPHSCVWVEIPNVFNDVNSYNNTAQQNLEEVSSSHGSPYEVVKYHFSFSNPDDHQGLFYFRKEGVPSGWGAILTPDKALLTPHERIDCLLTLSPPDNAPVCTEHRISVTSWTPRGNTLVQIGGGTVQVDLRNRTDIMMTTDLGPCGRNKGTVYTHQMAVLPANEKCFAIVAQGCTNPPRPFEQIIIRYQDPQGNPVYHMVTTDAQGCFSDSYVVAEGGEWVVTAEYPGNDCSGPVTTTPGVVGVPGGTRPGGDEPSGHRRYFSFHVGSTHPLGILDRVADANINAQLDLSIPLSGRLYLKAIGGVNQFTAESSTGIEHPRWINASVNLQFLFPTPSGLVAYLQAGPGNYWPKTGPSKVGFNAGVGGQIPISGTFDLAFGTDYHQIRADSPAEFFTMHLGVLW